MLLSTLLFAITGGGLIDLLIWIIILGVIFWICNWAIGYIGIPEPFNKVIKVILVLIVLVFLINALLSLGGAGFISFH